MKTFFGLILSVVILSLSFSGVAQTDKQSIKTIDTAVFSMPLHGAHCENIIQKRTPFEKGVIKVKADASTQTVKVIYQNTKTDVQKLIEHFKRIGYEATLVMPEK